jgi:clan AA aspartic protease
VYVKGTVSNNGKSVRLNFLVDSGAKYTLLPLKACKAIGLKPMESMEFLLADGTAIERQLSECKIKLLQRSRHTPVILGEGADEPLLGVITLEEFGLTFNPFERTLQPARMMLAAMDEGAVASGKWLVLVEGKQIERQATTEG